MAEVIAFGQEARRKLESLEQRDAELARINAELQKYRAELERAGKELSAQRRKLIPQLGKAVSRQLSDLGLKQSRFDVALESGTTDYKTAGNGSRLTLSGFDTVDFLFAPNPREPARPLRAIASSGELARLMLFLQTVPAGADPTPVR